MRIVVPVCAAIFALGFGAQETAAEDMSSMRVMSGMPNMGKGQWSIHVLEGGGGMPRTASICFESLAQLTRGPGMSPRNPGAQQPECANRVIENTADRGIVETTCPDGAMRATITRDGAKAFGAAVTLDKNSEQCQKMRAMAGMNPAQACANAGAHRQMCEEQLRRSLAQIQAMCQ